MQQKQIRRRRGIPAITPTTIPAMAPPLNPWEVEETIGNTLPEAVAGEMKGAVVVAAPGPLVGLKGAEKVLVAVAIVETIYAQLVNAPLGGLGAQEPE